MSTRTNARGPALAGRPPHSRHAAPAAPAPAAGRRAATRVHAPLGLLLAALALHGGAGGCQCSDDAVSFTAARLEVDPRTVDFDRVSVGRTAEKTIVVQNGGGAQLRLKQPAWRSGLREFTVDALPADGLSASQQVTLTLRYAPTAVAAHSDILVLEGEGDNADQRVEVVVTGRGVESADPQLDVLCAPSAGAQVGRCRIVDFGAVRNGEATVTVRNHPSAQGDLDVTSVRAVGAGFRVVEAIPATTLRPNELLTVRVAFEAQAAAGAASGCLLIASNDPEVGAGASADACAASGFQAYRNPWQVNLLAVAAAARTQLCVATPAGTQDCLPPWRIDFGDVSAGATVERAFTLRNIGDAMLRVTSLMASASLAPAEFTLTPDMAVPATLAPQAQLSVRLSYHPSDTRPDSGSVTLATDDAAAMQMEIAVAAQSAPDLDVNPLAVSFDNVPQGEEATHAVSLTNVGYAALNVSAIAPGAGTTAFTLRDLPTLPLVLQPGAPAATFTIVYRNPMPGDAGGRIVVTSDDPDEPQTEILLFARNVTNLPPVAEAGDDQTFFDFQAASAPTVMLDGSGSTDDLNQLTGYRWELVRVPRDSTVRLSSNNTVRTTFVPDVAGLYIVGLVVVDDLGQSSLRDDVNVTVNP